MRLLASGPKKAGLLSRPWFRRTLWTTGILAALLIVAYLVLMYDPTPPPFIGIEEPENFLHPRLLPGLAEDCRKASERSQLLVTTHSPYFVNALRPEEVRVLYRDEAGYTQAVRAADIQGIPEFMAAGASLGHLWMEGHFGVGDPLVDHGAPSGLRGEHCVKAQRPVRCPASPDLRGAK